MQHPIAERRQKRRLILLDWIVPGMATLALAVVAYLLMDRTPPIVPVSGRIEPATIRATDAFNVTWAMDVKRLCHGYVSRLFVDWTKKLHILDTTTLTRPLALGPVIIDRTHVLPLIPGGPAQYRMTMFFECSPLQRLWPIQVDFPALAFDVAP